MGINREVNPRNYMNGIGSPITAEILASRADPITLREAGAIAGTAVAVVGSVYLLSRVEGTPVNPETAGAMTAGNTAIPSEDIKCADPNGDGQADSYTVKLRLENATGIDDFDGIQIGEEFIDPLDQTPVNNPSATVATLPDFLTGARVGAPNAVVSTPYSRGQVAPYTGEAEITLPLPTTGQVTITAEQIRNETLPQQTIASTVKTLNCNEAPTPTTSTPTDTTPTTTGPVVTPPPVVCARAELKIAGSSRVIVGKNGFANVSVRALDAPIDGKGNALKPATRKTSARVEVSAKGFKFGSVLPGTIFDSKTKSIIIDIPEAGVKAGGTYTRRVNLRGLAKNGKNVFARLISPGSADCPPLNVVVKRPVK